MSAKVQRQIARAKGIITRASTLLDKLMASLDEGEAKPARKGAAAKKAAKKGPAAKKGAAAKKAAKKGSAAKKGRKAKDEDDDERPAKKTKKAKVVKEKPAKKAKKGGGGFPTF